jgi:hypothetical protein
MTTMNTHVNRPATFDEVERREAMWDVSHPMGQGFRILHAGFVAAPIIAGIDKFTNLLTDWTQYLAPIFPNTLGVSAQTFMYGVGIVEIAAGIAVAFMPRYASYVVTGWLWGIIANLLLRGAYYDVALRDFGLSLGALALGRIAEAHYQATHVTDTTDVATHTTVTEPTPIRRAA